MKLEYLKECPQDKYVRMTRESDLSYIAKYLRISDGAELEADDLIHLGVHRILKQSVDLSEEHYTGRVPTDFRLKKPRVRPCCLFGVALWPVTQHGVTYRPVWFLATPAVNTHKLYLARHSKPWVEYFFKKYGPIGNDVWSKNTTSLNWLKWLGFERFGSRYVPETGETFYTMVKTKPAL